SDLAEMEGAMARIRVGILGATGTVGQRFLALLANHPHFVVTAVAASDRSQGKPYGEACAWRLPGDIPPGVAALVVRAPEPPLECDVVFSSLPADVAGEVEAGFARAGYAVISNSSSHRMDDAVPLLIPEVNPDHLALLDACRGAGRGFIVTNPNCSTVMIALALAPLAARFGIEAVAVTTLQAISGAGYPGVASLDITDNVVPFIANEEEKIERETRKILGRLDGGSGGSGDSQCRTAGRPRVHPAPRVGGVGWRRPVVSGCGGQAGRRRCARLKPRLGLSPLKRGIALRRVRPVYRPEAESRVHSRTRAGLWRGG